MKAPLLEGEMWFVYHIEEPLMGYGVTTYRAYSKTEWAEPELHDGWANEIEFYSSTELKIGDKFVIWRSRETLGTVMADMMSVGFTKFSELMVTGCSRWQEGWRYWPTS